MKDSQKGEGLTHPLRHAMSGALHARSRLSIRDVMHFGWCIAASWLLIGMLGCAGSQHRGLNSAEKVILATYPVATQDAFATGFLLAIKNPAAKAGYDLVAITSGHLVKAAGGKPLILLLRTVASNGDVSGILVNLTKGPKRPPCVVHPLLDIAAFHIPIPQDMPAGAILPALHERDLDFADLRAGDGISVAGFPEGEGDLSGAFPLLRTGVVASIDQTFLGTPGFLINTGIYPGDSGAPVFLSGPGKRPRLVGMVVEYYRGVGENPMPMALAVDAHGIRETVDLLLHRQEEKPTTIETALEKSKTDLLQRKSKHL
ncbi:MAG TPA: serine protease [Chthoniobacterales bacterium]